MFIIHDFTYFVNMIDSERSSLVIELALITLYKGLSIIQIQRSQFAQKGQN